MELHTQREFGEFSRELARELFEATLPEELVSVLGRHLGQTAGVTGVLLTAGELGRWEWGRPQGEMVYSALLEHAGASLGELHLFGRREPQFRERIAEVSDFLVPAARNSLSLARYRQRARTDALTGLHNREAFAQRLEEEIARARRYELELSLIMIDVDGLKELNDAQGHLAGDRTIRAVGSCLERLVRRSDIVARYGGDEFVIILPGTGARAARRVIDRLQGEVAIEPEIPGVSAGHATLDREESADSFLARADQDMYRKKTSGPIVPQSSPVASSRH